MSRLLRAFPAACPPLQASPLAREAGGVDGSRAQSGLEGRENCRLSAGVGPNQPGNRGGDASGQPLVRACLAVPRSEEGFVGAGRGSAGVQSPQTGMGCCSSTPVPGV